MSYKHKKKAKRITLSARGISDPLRRLCINNLFLRVRSNQLYWENQKRQQSLQQKNKIFYFLIYFIIQNEL